MHTRRLRSGSSTMLHRLTTTAAAAKTEAPAMQSAPATDYYSRLVGKTVYRSSDGAAVDIPSLWDGSSGEKAVVAFGRSFG